MNQGANIHQTVKDGQHYPSKISEVCQNGGSTPLVIVQVMDDFLSIETYGDLEIAHCPYAPWNIY